MKKGRFQGGEGEQVKRASLGDVEKKDDRVSGCKDSPESSAES